MTQTTLPQQSISTSSKTPPLVPGLPFLGNTLAMRGDIIKQFTTWYHQYGALYRIRVLGKEIYVFAGLEANHFFTRNSETHFTNKDAYQPVVDEMGSDYLITYLSGDEHTFVRKALRPAYSREVLAVHYDLLGKVAIEHTAQWAEKGRIQVLPAVQNLITDQLGLAISGRALGDAFDAMRLYARALVGVLSGFTPANILQSREHLANRAKVDIFLKQLIEDHRQTPGGGDLIDLALTMHRFDGSEMSEYDQLGLAIGAYLAGMDTLSNTVAFALYALAKHPAILEEVRAEVDVAFRDGIPPLEAFRNMPKLHGAAVETLRMYPIGGAVPRGVAQTFDFGGYTVPKGARAFLATGVTHYLPEFFPEPYHFDITRNVRTAPPGAYAPFSLGAHTCLGAGLAEGLLMFSMAMIIHKVDFTLDPAGYEAKIAPAPTPNPGLGLYMRIKAR